MSYASVQAIRESAGLLSRSENETPNGTVDGSNKSFTVKRRPIVDSDYDDDVTVSDVQARVNGSSVVVSSVDATTGVFVLAAAPTAGQKVTVDYRFSPLTDDYVSGKQQEADSWVDMKIKPYVAIPLNPIPGILSTVAEMYAAGLILTKDWGNRNDTELTSKDGNQKLKTARELLADYLQGVEDEKKALNTAGQGSASVLTDADPFSRTGFNRTTDEEDFFMRRDC
jgi:hypothetical protein